MELKNLGKLIDFAIAEEKKAADLYLGLMKKVKDKGSKTMLREMAEMEQAHERKLKAFKAGKEGAPMAGNVPNLKMAEYMIENTLSAESGIQDVVLFAIQCEKKAWQLYSDIAKVYEDAEKKSFMTALASEELRHKNGLEKAYDDEIFKEN